MTLNAVSNDKHIDYRLYTASERLALNAITMIRIWIVDDGRLTPGRGTAIVYA